MKDDTLLARWLAGELDEHEMEALRNDPKYGNYVRIKDNLDGMQSPAFNADAMLQDILRHQKTSTKVIPIYRKKWMQIAAVAVVLLGLAVAFVWPVTQKAGYGQTYAFTLPDQSHVILNSGSSAKYSGWNWDSHRDIALNGEAYFKVAKGKKFTVSTSLGTVSVLGTQFNVRARGYRFDVVCYEGRVLVVSNGKETILIPGQRVTFNAAAIENGQTRNTEPEWLHKELLFTHENLTDVVSEIERHYNVKIDIEAQSQQLFSGSLPGDSLDAALNVLCMTFHLQKTRSADTIILNPAHDGA
jgi:transmembrane sensor